MAIDQNLSSIYINIVTLPVDYKVDEDKYLEHGIAPSIKLPPMSLNSKHRNYSFEAQT